MLDNWTRRASEEAPPVQPGLGSGATDSPLAERRRYLIEKFSAWIDTVLEEESVPGGAAGELLALVQGEPLETEHEPCDQFALWSSLTSLFQEVKLQGRAFKELTESIRPLQGMPEVLSALDAQQKHDVVGQTLAALEASRADLERTIAASVSQVVWREVLDLLLDFRDRLLRNADTLRSALVDLRETQGGQRIPRWFPSVRQAKERLFRATESVIEGNGLFLGRLDEALLKLGVHEIPWEGNQFDPAAMKAVGVEHRSDCPDGAVVAIHRRGYTWRGHIYRLAEVSVVRNSASTTTNPPEEGGENEE